MRRKCCCAFTIRQFAAAFKQHSRYCTVDEVTGDVYIGTANGLVSYRGDATAGTTANEEELVAFPNPVACGLQWFHVAIKNLPENVDVRITDIAGQLVFRAQSAGGQANLEWPRLYR